MLRELHFCSQEAMLMLSLLLLGVTRLEVVGGQLVLQVLADRGMMRVLHRELALALGVGAQHRGVAEHVVEGNLQGGGESLVFKITATKLIRVW